MCNLAASLDVYCTVCFDLHRDDTAEDIFVHQVSPSSVYNCVLYCTYVWNVRVCFGYCCLYFMVVYGRKGVVGDGRSCTVSFSCH